MAPSTSYSLLADLSDTWLEALAGAGEMFAAATLVVGHRTARMAFAGPIPSERDRTEFSLMSREKEEAAAESLQAFGLGFFNLAMMVAVDTSSHVWATSAAALALASSQSPSQWLERQTAWVEIATEAPANPLRLANSAARVMQESVAPIHDRATANAKRLGALDPVATVPWHPGKATRQQNPIDATNVVSNLDSVSETMLWTLYDRACESGRADAVLIDHESARICKAIDYDFAGRFGDPDGSFAARAAEIDHLLIRWLENHPDGVVVSLGEGLETQGHRVDNGRMQWLTVDLPAAIEFRENFLKPSKRFRHIAASALDPVWANEIEPATDVFIVAQGLFMYLQPQAVKRLIADLVARFPTAELVFDVVPQWFSSLTMWGVMKTPSYRLPPMPWGIDADNIGSCLRDWSSGIETINLLEYRAPRGWPKLMEDLLRMNPDNERYLPCLVHVMLKKGNCDRPSLTISAGPLFA
ncbi:MAG: polyhydroxyalkanoate granule-associated phasin [Janthinobacterium lividum]